MAPLIKLVIFDLDGTLVDSARDIHEAANLTLQFYKMDLLDLETVQEHIGAGFGPFLKSVAGERFEDKNYCEEIFLKFQSFYDKQLLKHTAFYAGVEKFLGEFINRTGRKLGVISNKPEYQVRLILKGLGLAEKDLVEIYGGDRFDVKKPHPKPLLEMMKLADVTPDETLMVGDSRADVEAAKGAGTHFVAVRFGYNSPEKLKGFGAEHFIGHYDELGPLLTVLCDTALSR